ncbi:MAG: hypothetical protein FJ276_33890, partial [Planctomycetes bacterium]|nr:hypothetical protein [Planctomycetota bacterium]
MKEVGGSIVYKRLRAPSEDGQVFVDPVVASKSSWLARNVALHRGTDCDLHGCRLAELQTAARRQLLASAR